MNTETNWIENSHTNGGVLPRDNGALEPGQLVLANESRFNSSFFSEPLTAYATGWRDPSNLEALLDFIAPPVQTGRRFEFKKADNSEAFLAETDEQRAIGASFKTVEYRGSTAIEKTVNKGLTLRMDLDLIGDMPNWREAHTARLLQRLLRNELRRAVELMTSAAGNTGKVWDSSAGKDPDQDVIAELHTAIDASGVRPNRALYGEIAWNKRLLSHRAQSTAGGYASSGLTPEELAGFLGLDGVRVSRERYQATINTKGKVTPDLVLLFVAETGASIDDPTHLKRFWSAAEGGMKFRVYEQQINAKLVDLTVEHYSNVVLTSNLGLRKISVT